MGMYQLDLYNETFKYKISILIGKRGIYLKDFDGDDEVYDAELVEKEDGTKYLYIDIDRWSNELVAHECVHIAMDLCERKGIPISKENEEVVGYLVEWFDSKIQTFFSEEILGFNLSESQKEEGNGE